MEYGKQVKKRDGSIVQVLLIRSDLNSNFTGSPFHYEKIKAMYRVNKKIYYSLPVSYKDNKIQIEIETGKTSFVEVFIFARGKDSVYTAETSFYLFGKSEKHAEKELPEGKPGPFPIVTILSPAFNYWPQTGCEYRFKINSGKKVRESMEIMAINEYKVSSLTLSGNGEFKYSPPHDRDLDLQGAGAYKSAVIYIREKSGGRIFIRTYTLLFHRSRYGYYNLKSGLFLISGSMVFFFLLVILRRGKRFR